MVDELKISSTFRKNSMLLAFGYDAIIIFAVHDIVDKKNGVSVNPTVYLPSF